MLRNRILRFTHAGRTTKKGPQNVNLWSGRRGSNPRPSAWKADALPTELLPQFFFNKKPIVTFRPFVFGGANVGIFF